MDSEDLRKGGLILYEENSYNPKFNAGEYFELFLTKLDKDSKFLFSQPLLTKKKFTIEENPMVWYSKSKIGINAVGNAMPEIAKAAGCSRKLTNHQLRATAINHLIANLKLRYKTTQFQK